MPVREVLQLGHPDLRRPSAPVGEPRSPEVAAVVRDLEDTLRYWRTSTGYGRAISAPQIGHHGRLVYVASGVVPGHDGPLALVDPEIVEASAERMVVWDACLSFLTIFFQVERHARVRVRYTGLDGERRELEAEGDVSELLQHELDHLDGVLAIDRMSDVATMCSREEFEKRHRAESPYGRRG